MNSQVLPNVSGVAIDGRALLIEGAPGSGKSSLALALIDRGASLIGDDAVTISERSGQIIAEPPPNTAGMIEIRNVGIVELPTVEAQVALVLSLDPAAARFPLELGQRVLLGTTIPLLTFAPGDAVQALRAEYALAQHGLPFPNRTSSATREHDG
ncbi:HPr kinase/phosphorylase [Erythrobacter mangrovi]|uniref:Serine kinase n=1 Tax=Erythrobacter mangrovi TaxID=2739433 RepID=A0A7D3XG90_9SPHN|nr:HPr kinase/phosphatase C-terminal domain-containing protein [Erythrobacter mangrovi]QKG70058.1 serine kinase [Erythrobacter mangrovi]